MDTINILNEIFGVPISIVGLALAAYVVGLTSLSFFSRFMRVIGSSSEKIKREAITKFNKKEKKFLDQIENTPNKKEKKKLKQALKTLRLEHESRMSGNLQKKDGKFTTDWCEVLLAARKRLLDEEQRLQVRNVVNLVTGIVSVLVGAGFFGSFLYLNHDDRVRDYLTFIDFLVLFGTRIGIIITIGVFAGFFLRLYSLTERAIANNKNEITNIELRLTSGLMLSEKANTDKFAMLADTLSKEERNFILGKNESSATSETLDIERLKEIISLLVSVGTK